jgi:hypothetical protein
MLRVNQLDKPLCLPTEAEDLRLRLAELEVHQGFLVVIAHCQRRKFHLQRLLAAEGSPAVLYRYQGELKVIEEMLEVVSSLDRELAGIAAKGDES